MPPFIFLKKKPQNPPTPPMLGEATSLILEALGNAATGNLEAAPAL